MIRCMLAAISLTVLTCNAVASEPIVSSPVTLATNYLLSAARLSNLYATSCGMDAQIPRPDLPQIQSDVIGSFQPLVQEELRGLLSSEHYQAAVSIRVREGISADACSKLSASELSRYRLARQSWVALLARMAS